MLYTESMPRQRTKLNAMSFRVTDECRSLIDRLSEVGGVSQASIIERAVRLLARTEGIYTPSGASIASDPRAPYDPKDS